MIEEIRDELSCERDLTSNLKLQLQRTQESNSNLILAVRDLNELLEEKKNEISSLNSALEEMDSGGKEGEEMDKLKQRIEELDWELESYRRKNEEQEILLDDLTREYDSLKEEKHKHVEVSDSKDVIEELEGKLKQQSLEYSECLITVNELESQVKELKKEVEDQARAFDEDMETMMREKTEQEQRAIKAEENLRKTRWKFALAKEEAKTVQRELTLSKTSNDEKETRLGNLKREVEGLSLQYSELQNSFVQEKMENEELRKQVSTLKVDIRRKEEEMTKILDARYVDITTLK